MKDVKTPRWFPAASRLFSILFFIEVGLILFLGRYSPKNPNFSNGEVYEMGISGELHFLNKLEYYSITLGFAAAFILAAVLVAVYYYRWSRS